MTNVAPLGADKCTTSRPDDKANLLPEIALLFEEMSARHGKDVDCTLMSSEKGRARAALQNRKWNTDLPAEILSRDVTIDSRGHPEGREVSGTLFIPPNPRPGVTLYAHGGGFAFGSPACQSRFTSLLAQYTGQVVLSLDYQLAPEAPFPAGLHDVVAALRFLSSNQDKLGLQSGPVSIAGESAGANLAISALIYEIRAGRPARVAGALLICGNYQHNPDTASAKAFYNGPGLTIPRMARYWSWYAPEGKENDPTLFPLSACDDELLQLPPLAIYAAGIDPLLTDSTMLFERCVALKHPVTLEVVPHVLHGFIQMSRDVPEVQCVIQRMAAAVLDWTFCS
ncbi:alpha/beta hydrolase [Ahrensia kielensis]|uniref:Alpha/beta hydrolase n=1 Tax=Ahrensia kielensis TaxID=76980 RepID=A0ABU9T1G3_9HYPH